MAGQPQEAFAPAVKESQPKQPTQISVQEGDNKAFLEEHRESLQRTIKKGSGDIGKIDGLTDQEKSNVIKMKDSSGRNVLLSTVNHCNVALFKNLLVVITTLSLTDVLYLSEDNEGNNLLHLAIKTGNHEVFTTVWEVLTSSAQSHLSAMITKRNLNHQNAYDLALTVKSCTNWIGSHLLPYTCDVHFRLLWRTPCEDSYADFNTIMHAVQRNEFKAAADILQKVREGRCYAAEDMEDIFMKPFVTVHLGTPKRSLMEILVTERIDNTNEDVITIHKLYIGSITQENLYNKLTLEIDGNKPSILSFLIKGNFEDIIRGLLGNERFRETLLRRINDEDGPFSRTYLESHAMTSLMLAMFNNIAFTFYLTLTDYTLAKPHALLFFTQDHTPPHSKMCRSGASEECKLFGTGLSEIGYQTHILSGHQQLWRKKDLFQWLGDELASIKDKTSQLFIVGFTHGEDGYLFDSSMGRIAIADIVERVNSCMYPGIPIVFIFQACRGESTVATCTPNPKLSLHNCLLMSCAVSQNSRRHLYAEEFVKQIRKGTRNINDISKSVQHAIAYHKDQEVRQQTPQGTDCLPKELILPSLPT